MRRGTRAALAIVNVLLGLVAVAAIVVVLLTGTDWGHERMRRIALSQLQGMVHGRVHIGSITGNLLNGMVVHDFAITDSAGQPFLAAESVSGDYKLGELLRKRIWVDNLKLVHPVLVLDRPPDGKWNYQRIFQKDTLKTPARTGPGFGDWVRFTNATVVEGRLVVRSPWHPSERLATQTARDSAIRDVLSGSSRLMVERAPGGFQKIVELRSLSAKFPVVRLADPGQKNRFARVASLEMTAYPFRPPAAVVTGMRGDFQFNNDSLWWQGVQAAMPQSRVSGDGRYSFESGDMTLKLHGAPASFADLRWLYPRLPAEGRGTLDFLMNWQGAAQDYIARNANISVGSARLAGSFGLTLTDTFTIHHTDLRVANVDTRLLEQLIPHFESPRRGTLSGHAIVSGGKHALLVNGDAAFSDRAAGTSRFAAAGEIGFLPGGLRARRLRVRAYPIQVELARKYMPTMPVSGTVTGTAYVDGNTATQLTVTGDLTHTDRGALSRLDGRATIRLAGRKWFDVDARVHPLSLAEVGRFAPAIGLRGTASGPLRLRGTLDRLTYNSDLRVADGGRIAANGTLDLASPQKGYTLDARMRLFNVRTVVAKAPATSLTGRVVASGRGFDPKTMRATLAADLGTSSWDSIAVDRGTVRLAIANGLLQVNQAELRGAHTTLGASGSFGLAAGRSGELTYRLAIDSLGAYNRWLPRTAADTGAVAPRPGRVAAAIARARADSARLDKETEVERAISGAPPPKLRPRIPPPVRRDTIAGSLIAAGTVRGNIRNFDLRGRLAAEDLVARGNSANRLRAEYAWTAARTPNEQFFVAAKGDSITAGGFSFDSVDARLAYRKPGGHAEIVVLQNAQREYALTGDFTFQGQNRELRIANATLRFDTTQWRTTRVARIHWHPQGIEVHDLELHDRGIGRIYANGLLPTQGRASFVLEVDNFDVANVADLLQSDVKATGVVSLTAGVEGTLSDPRIRGAFGLVDGSYQGTPVPELHGTFAYAGQLLTTHLDAVREGGAPMAVADAKLPIDLRLQGVTGGRLLDRPLALDLVADSLPLELVPYVTDQVQDVAGLAAGKIAVRGTLKRPSVVGSLMLARGRLTINSLGARITDITGSIRMLNDSIRIDSIVGYAKGPVRIRGSIGVGSWRTPSFNVFLVANNAELVNNDRARLRVDAGLALTGPFNDVYASGQVKVTQGVVYANTSTRQVISAEDPTLFQVVDTAVASELDLIPQHSPLLQNLRADIQVAISRNTWVRSQEANVEVFTEYPVAIHYEHEQVSLIGAVATDRGDYTFLSKRFQVKRGSAQFVGGPQLDPLVQVAAEYEVAVPGQPALHINITIGGTLKRPRLLLSSDAQPPKSQSELLSYLAFGRSTTSLMSFSQGSSVSSLGSSGDLVGYGANLAVRQLAAVALGVAANEVESEAGKATGADVFNITPADVPSELLQGQGITNFLMQTRVEAGKYLNPRTFVGLQQTALLPGASLQYRTGRGWVYTLSSEPRVLAKEPTLSSRPFYRVQAIGAFIVREWRF